MTFRSPFIALIDDDQHSAALLVRTLASIGAPTVHHLGGATDGESALRTLLEDLKADWPDLLLVDLKGHSSANLDFVLRIKALMQKKGVPLAVMSQAVECSAREVLLEAGASAVFFRQPERDAYRREAVAIMRFQARNQRLDAVGM